MKAVLVAFAVAAIAALTLPAATADQPKPCHRSKFDTELVKKACASGGQAAAKAAMKDFVKKAKKVEGGDPDLTCDSCHGELAPDYPLSEGALARFKKLSALVN